MTRLGGDPDWHGCTQGCRVGQPLRHNRNFISESRSINVRAVNIPMDGHGWPPRSNADCNVYIGPWHPNASSKDFSSILIPSMRLPLLLTSFLVVLPVSLICLSLNLRILYYFDRSFMVCYTLPNLFTGHIVHDHLLPVTAGKIVHSQVQK